MTTIVIVAIKPTSTCIQKGTNMTVITPGSPVIPVCGVKEMIISYPKKGRPETTWIFCAKNKGHPGPHLANLAWEEDE